MKPYIVKPVMLATKRRGVGIYVSILGLIYKDEPTEKKDWQPMNLYLTSDEPIKEGDWYYYPEADMVLLEDGEMCPFDRSKVVATTDPTLLSDGIPSIPENIIKDFVSKQGKVESYRLETESIFVAGNYDNTCCHCKKVYHNSDKLWFLCQECSFVLKTTDTNEVIWLEDWVNPSSINEDYERAGIILPEGKKVNYIHTDLPQEKIETYDITPSPSEHNEQHSSDIQDIDALSEMHLKAFLTLLPKISKTEVSENDLINAEFCYTEGYKQCLEDRGSDVIAFAEWIRETQKEATLPTYKEKGWVDKEGGKIYSTEQLYQLWQDSKNKQHH